MRSIDQKRYDSIIVLTGAGISVASGLRPYRGPGGIWEEAGIAHLATAEAIEKDPHAVWKLFGPLREKLQKCEPNEAHRALARMEQARNSGDFLLVTQNIDGLHQRAGSKNVLELHGRVYVTRCSNRGCYLTPYEDDETHLDELPLCPKCGSYLRPDIVLFGEPIATAASHRVKVALRSVTLFLAVGTSGSVAPASRYVNSADYMGARTVLVNLQKMTPPNRAFHEEYLGRAEELLPKLLI